MSSGKMFCGAQEELGEEKFFLAPLFSRPEGSVVKKFSLNLHK